MWSDLVSVKKGDVGERLFNHYLIEKGFIPYSPDADGAHPFDRLIATRDKRHIFIADVKTKPARRFYPDTGMNITHYEQYSFIQRRHGVNTFVCFVDEDAGKAYGNWLRKLSREITIMHRGFAKKYPLRENGIIYFPLVAMKDLFIVSDEAAIALRKFSTRSKEYVPAVSA